MAKSVDATRIALFGALAVVAAILGVTLSFLVFGGPQSVVSSEDVNRPVVDPEERDLFALLNANNYPKGGWVLHMLRGILGDDVFFRGIREYYARHLHQAVLTDDFRAVMEDVSGADLAWFFRQWIHQPGYPVFEVASAWSAADAGEGTLELTVRQVQDAAWPASFFWPSRFAGN